MTVTQGMLAVFTMASRMFYISKIFLTVPSSGISVRSAGLAFKTAEEGGEGVALASILCRFEGVRLQKYFMSPSRWCV